MRHSSDRRLTWSDDGIALVVAMGDAFYKMRRYPEALKHYERAKQAIEMRGKAAVDIFAATELGISLEAKTACTLSMLGVEPTEVNNE
eukprot:8885423-Pyramimonas_sp.AAC.1